MIWLYLDRSQRYRSIPSPIILAWYDMNFERLGVGLCLGQACLRSQPGSKATDQGIASRRLSRRQNRHLFSEGRRGDTTSQRAGLRKTGTQGAESPRHRLRINRVVSYAGSPFSTSTSSATTSSCSSSALASTIGLKSGFIGLSVIVAWCQRSPSLVFSLS